MRAMAATMRVMAAAMSAMNTTYAPHRRHHALHIGHSARHGRHLRAMAATLRAMAATMRAVAATMRAMAATDGAVFRDGTHIIVSTKNGRFGYPSSREHHGARLSLFFSFLFGTHVSEDFFADSTSAYQHLLLHPRIRRL